MNGLADTVGVREVTEQSRLHASSVFVQLRFRTEPIASRYSNAQSNAAGAAGSRRDWNTNRICSGSVRFTDSAGI